LELREGDRSETTQRLGSGSTVGTKGKTGVKADTRFRPAQLGSWWSFAEPGVRTDGAREVMRRGRGTGTHWPPDEISDGWGRRGQVDGAGPGDRVVGEGGEEPALELQVKSPRWGRTLLRSSPSSPGKAGPGVRD
jgi:hypothetical protein